MIKDGRIKWLNSIASVIMDDLRKNRIREWMLLREEKDSEASISYILSGRKEGYKINLRDEHYLLS